MNYRTRYGDANHKKIALKKMGYTGLTGAHAQAIASHIQPPRDQRQFNEEEVRHTLRTDMNPLILNERRLHRQYTSGNTGETIEDALKRSMAEFPGAGRRNGYRNPELHRAATTSHPVDPTVYDFCEHYEFRDVPARHLTGQPVPTKAQLEDPAVDVGVVRLVVPAPLSAVHNQ